MTPQSLASEVSTLFALPDVALRACTVMDSPTSSARELVAVIELDAGLTSTVLRLANSALYGQSGRVENLSRAVTLIGHQALRDLVLATSAVQTFRDIPEAFMDMDTFWANSISCGVLADLIARRLRLAERGTLFIAGLMHGVGRLVFYATRPTEYREVLRRVNAEGADLIAAERQVFGFTYAELGAALLQAWDLPEKLQVLVGHQLTPAKAPAFAREAAVVHLARDMTATLAPCLKTKAPLASYTPDPAYLSELGLDLSQTDLDDIRLDAMATSLEIIEIVRPGSTVIY